MVVILAVLPEESDLLSVKNQQAVKESQQLVKESQQPVKEN
jgi:hypothetical protein